MQEHTKKRFNAALSGAYLGIAIITWCILGIWLYTIG
jgi:uncharacterized membrane protein